MFKQLIQKAAQFITGGPYRVILDKQKEYVALKTFKGKKPVPLSQLIKRHESLAGIDQKLIPQEEWHAVRLRDLIFVKQILADVANNELEIDIAPDVVALQPTNPPAGFEIRYFWSYDNGRIEKRTSQNAAYFGDGWFVGNNQYWQIKGISIQDDHWLRQKCIEEQSIIEFLSQIIPRWQNCKLPFSTPLKYSTDPVLSITIKEVANNQVTLNVDWKESANKIRINLSEINHVIAAGIVRPGIHPSQISVEALKTNGVAYLQAEIIPQFQQEVWPLIHKWVDGNIAQYQAKHTIFQTKGQIKLIVQSEDEQGIGMAVAVPTFVCSHFRIPAHEAAKLLASSKQYYRIDNGWVPTNCFEQAGITATNLSQNGRSLSPIILTPAEILHRGSERLQDVWSNVAFPVVKLPESEMPVKTATLHLQFLKTWGIPGGIIGSIDQYQKAFETLFTTLVAAHPTSKILVVGANKNIEAIASQCKNIVTNRFNGNKSDHSFNPFQPGIVLATPKALTVHSEMIKTEWTILCLLEADSLVKSNRSKLFQQLVKSYKMLTIGSFSSNDFLKRTQNREALSQLFGLPPYMGGSFVWGYALRDPIKSAPPLPSPYRTRTNTKHPIRQGKTAEFNIGNSSGARSMPIPPRKKVTKRIIDDSPFQIEIKYTSHESSFVQQAQKWVNHTEKRAHFVPFQQYWPQYDSMTARQQKWYFYWRTKVRKGIYPDTDLSYIFIHVYELINNVGVQNKMNGYEQLRQLWLHYRERYPKLDNYLLDWMIDYVLVNDCAINPLALYADEAVEKNVSPRELDLVLANYIGKPLTRMSIVLVDKLTDYQILRSKFYLNGNQQLVDEYVPQMLEHLNLHLQQQFGANIFERFKPRQPTTIRRRPFQSAIYDGKTNEITVATIFPYTSHPPLRHFLTGVVKHTENKLRELKGVNGRLRGFTLDPAIQAVIDQFIVSKTHIIVPPPPKPKIVIDPANVARLINDQSEIFQMLQVSQEENEESANAIESETPSAIQVDFNPIASQRRQAEEGSENFTLSHTSDAKRATESNQGSTDAQHHQSTLTNSDNQLPPEWFEFAQQLADYQFQTIKAIVTEDDASATISQIAEANITMPAPLLDEINEIAQDTIGDIIIDIDPTPHVSDEEYLELLQALIAAKN